MEIDEEKLALYKPYPDARLNPCSDVEMQGANDDNAYGQRAEYLCARLLNSSFQRGKKWNQMKRVYQISVVDFVFDRESKVAVRHFHMKDDEAGHFLSNGIQTVIFLELPKIARLGDVAPGQLNSEENGVNFYWTQITHF